MTAVPKRLPVLWAKALVYGAVVLRARDSCDPDRLPIGQSILARSTSTSRSPIQACRVRLRRRSLPDCDRSLRARDRRNRPQHRGRDRDLRGNPVRPAATDERVPDQLEQRGQPVPAARRRPGDHVPHPKPPPTRALDRARASSARIRQPLWPSHRSCSSDATPDSVSRGQARRGHPSPFPARILEARPRARRTVLRVQTPSSSRGRGARATSPWRARPGGHPARCTARPTEALARARGCPAPAPRAPR